MITIILPIYITYMFMIDKENGKKIKYFYDLLLSLRSLCFFSQLYDSLEFLAGRSVMRRPLVYRSKMSTMFL